MHRKPPDNETLAGLSGQPWTQHEIDLLHDMVRDYDRARWLRGQMKWWAVWLLGVPTAGLSVWKTVEELLRIIRGGH